MDGSQWIGLFRRIPESQHDCLILATGTGIQFVIKRIVSLERDFVLAVGRLGGSNEHPKPLLIPYDQLSYVLINKHLDEGSLQSLLDGRAASFNERVQIDSRPEPRAIENPPAPALDRPTAGARPSFLGVSDNGQRMAEVSAENTPGKAEVRNAPPSKSVLLARLRQRLADDAIKKTGA